ncbi:hypothetical protein [Sorangium sp. So ce1151]|uniref:hypothetical protein n=1 Tax=Sorangium sp. So ce1151 TaxID=3133332 RepID=UPI003F60986F
MAQYSGNDTFPASAELVNDGTVRDAGSVNVLAETALDRTTFLRNVGFRRVAAWSHTNEVTIRSWTFSATTYAPNTSFPSDWLVTVPNARVGDIITVDASGIFASDASTSFWRLGATDNSTGGGSEVLLPGYVQVGIDDGEAQQQYATISTYHTVVTAGATRLRMLGRYEGTLGTIFAIIATGVLRATLLRPTGSSA